MGDQPGRALRRLADRRRRLRVLLRLHRRRGPPVLPGHLRGHHPRRALQDARRGLPLHGGHDRQGHQVGPPAEDPDGRQAVLRLLRPRRRPRPPPRAQGVGRQVQGQVRPGLGPAARGVDRAAEGPWRDPGRRRAHPPPRRDPGLGRHARGAQAGADPPDGGVRRLPRARRPPRRAPDRRPPGPRCPGRHAGHLRHRGQRRLGRGHPERDLQRDDQLQRRRGHRDAGVHDRAAGQVRRAGLLQPLRGRLGPCHGHPVPVDQAGRLPLRRHPQRDDHPLAERLPVQRRAAPASSTT